MDDVLSEDPFNVGRNARQMQNEKESWLFAGASFPFQAVNQYIKRPPPPPPLANKRERRIFSCLRMATRRLGNMFRREMFKTFGAGARVASNNPTDTLQLFSLLLLPLAHNGLFDSFTLSL